MRRQPGAPGRRGRYPRLGNDAVEGHELLDGAFVRLSVAAASDGRCNSWGVAVQYAYRRVTRAPFPETVKAVERAAREHGFVVLESLDIQASLAAKGFPIRPLVIVELGPAAGEKDELVALLLPCRLNVYEEDGEVAVAALRPSLFRAVYPERDLEAAAARLEQAVIAVVDEACG